ncbi:MAG: DUF3859 domain-containing protein [Humidesulfovibrio sp.]|nr:hypothetical protein [Desulfovibrio sp.]MDO9081962.1 DUF3859 domain-containing protein [Humidesulfovibrio sp.]
MEWTRRPWLVLAALCALALLGTAQAAPTQPEGIQAEGIQTTGIKTAGVKKAKPAKPVPVKVTGVKVLEFGVYTSTVQGREKAPTIADGIKDRARDFKLVRKSTLVTASLGTSIGLKYVLLGAPKGSPVTLEVAVRHPAMVNPDTKESMTRSTAQFERVIGEPEHAVWSFDTPAGLIPGEYVIELLFEGRLLAQKEFRVTVRR